MDITEKSVSVGNTIITLVKGATIKYPPDVPVYTDEDGLPMSAAGVFSRYEDQLRAGVEKARLQGYDFWDVCPVVSSLMEPAGRAFALLGGATEEQIAEQFTQARERCKIVYAVQYLTHPSVAARLRRDPVNFDIVADIVEAAPDGSWAWTVVIFGGQAHVFRLRMKAGK
jgi:hypothetical protein